MGDRRAIDRDAEALRGVEVGQLPQPSEQAARRPARDHDRARVLDPHVGAREHGQLVLLLARRHDGELVLPARAVRGAHRLDRADQAARRRRRADRGAELHEALVEIAGLRVGIERGHQLAGLRPQRLHALRRLHVLVDREHAREHPRDVAVDERRALAVRDRGDRARRVGSDARHAAELARRARQRLAHRLRAGVEVPRARVVAEAGPRGEHVVERCGRERGDRREPRHPALPVRDHRRDPRLLQHDLADPDRVRVTRAPPRQIALHARVVRDDRAGDLAWFGHAVRIPQ